MATHLVLAIQVIACLDEEAHQIHVSAACGVSRAAATQRGRSAHSDVLVVESVQLEHVGKNTITTCECSS